uniref:Uncharacterized protein n=1 Tax=Heterosigma akashiwo TaxID=2829 RepID=A0A1D8GXK1_HETAK|nr:hypothetical protein [Heterosigma akashiwo]
MNLTSCHCSIPRHLKGHPNKSVVSLLLNLAKYDWAFHKRSNVPIDLFLRVMRFELISPAWKAGNLTVDIYSQKNVF